MKKLFLFLAVSFGCAAHAAMRTDNLTVTGQTVVGSTVIINSTTFYHPAAASIPEGLSVSVFSSTNNSVNYYNVVTDPARRGGANVFTSTNSFMEPVIIGTSVVSSPSDAGDLIKVKVATNEIWKITLSSGVHRAISTATISGITGATLANAGTFDLDSTIFDFAGSSIVLPTAASTASFSTGNYLWWNTATRNFYLGPNPAGSWRIASNVVYSTFPVVIGSVPASVGSDVLYAVYAGNNPRMTIAFTSATVHAVGSVTWAAMSTFTLTNVSRVSAVREVATSSVTANVTANTNNWALTDNYAQYRSSATTAVNITGISNTALDERQMTIFNVGTGTMTFIRESANSDASNRFLIPADFSIGEDVSATFKYDNTKLRWRRMQ